MNPLMYAYGPMGYSPFGAFMGSFVIIAVVAALWSLFWAGLGLWHAARNNQWGWFLAILLIHTVGILELIYIFKFRNDRSTESAFPWKMSSSKPSQSASDGSLPVAESSPAE